MYLQMFYFILLKVTGNLTYWHQASLWQTLPGLASYPLVHFSSSVCFLCIFVRFKLKVFESEELLIFTNMSISFSYRWTHSLCVCNLHLNMFYKVCKISTTEG